MPPQLAYSNPNRSLLQHPGSGLIGTSAYALPPAKFEAEVVRNGLSLSLAPGGRPRQLFGALQTGALK